MSTTMKSQTPNPESQELKWRFGTWHLGLGIWDLVLVALVVSGATLSSGCSYNRFVGKEEAIKTQWSQVENQLQRRNDLIPNLVETTKGIAQQEKDVFGQIADSRAKMAGARTPDEQIQAANQQSAALARLLVVVENYPQLRSSESF